MQDIKGVLIDIDGVVHQRGAAIAGSVEAIERLKRLNLQFRFITNTTRTPLRIIAAQLEKAGAAAERSHIFTPALAARTYLEEHDLDPFFRDQLRLEGGLRQSQSGEQARYRCRGCLR